MELNKAQLQILEIMYNDESVFTHSELANLVVPLKNDDIGDLFRAGYVSRDGYNYELYKYKITAKGRACVEAIKAQQCNRAEDVGLQKESNENGRKANVIAVIAIVTSVVLSVTSFIISLVALTH